MKKFSVLKYSSNIQDVGVFTQTEFEPKELNDNLIIYTDDWVNKIHANTVFDLTLRKTAIQTDFISDSALSNAASFCYSNKAKQVLGDFKIDSNKTARVNLHRKETISNYEYMHLLNSRLNYIDWNESSFAKTRIGFFEHHLDIYSMNAYYNCTKSISPNKILASNLVLDAEKIEYDLFFIGLPINAILVSNKLKSALEKRNISGLSFIPLDSFTRVKGIN